MRWRLLVWAGALTAVVGVIWTLQGLGYVGGSAMTGETVWAVVGPMVVVAGLAMAAIGIRASRSGSQARLDARRPGVGAGWLARQAGWALVGR